MCIVIIKLDVVLASIWILTNKPNVLQVNLLILAFAEEFRQWFRRFAVKVMKIQGEVFVC